MFEVCWPPICKKTRLHNQSIFRSLSGVFGAVFQTFCSVKQLRYSTTLHPVTFVMSSVNE